MRNLELLCSNARTTNIKDAKYLVLDANGKAGLKYVATEQTLYAVSNDEIVVEIPGIVGAEYIALDNELCVATEMGEVILINADTLEQREGTFCDVGLEGMSWSPDQEVVTFVTKTHNVVVMTCTYDPLAEHPLAIACDGDGQFMNVGWGKKETQFHGSEGKTAAKQKGDFQAPENLEELPKNIEITWRADGNYFAVSFLSADLGRMFKVFDKEGQLNYTSEKQNNLQPQIAWRPSGTWIAVPQQMPNKSIIALFEKNGLKHREIVLPFAFATEPIRQLRWSSDSEVLAIETTTEQSNNLYLYTIGNYHWYMKQKLVFKAPQHIAAFAWDQRMGEEKTLFVFCETGEHFTYKWHWGVARAPQGTVTVVDGKNLLHYDMDKTVVPPPMSDRQEVLDEPINESSYTGNNLVYLNANNELFVNGNKKTFVGGVGDAPLVLSNVIVLTENFLLAKAMSSDNKTGLYFLQLAKDSYEAVKACSINGVVVGRLAYGDGQIYAQTEDGHIHQISVDMQKLSASVRIAVADLHYPADHIVCHHKDLAALTHNKSLYVNSTLIANDVTSICPAGGQYLAFTKLKSLHFLRWSDRQVIGERKIERGGILVVSVSKNQHPRIVLQMPRGNLETFCPRIFSFEKLNELLDQHMYHQAMDMLRKQRINLNMLCDYRFDDFMTNLLQFINDITDVNWMNLFISELQNEDFTKTMYAEYYRLSAPPSTEYDVQRKVATVCEGLCKIMERDASGKYLLPTITAYVKMGEMKKALELIWQAKKNESSAGVDPATKPSNTADASLKYLLYLVDVNTLYNIALSTYDFGLVLFVVQKSQKDPKEYLPFLNELKKLEENYRCFRIDEFNKSYASALRHICKCGRDRFAEALEFIKRHHLYGEALQCVWSDEECLREIALAFGDNLRAAGKHENASIMYERGGNLQQALLSAKHVLDWQRVIQIASKDATCNVGSTALSLVASLTEAGKYEEAYHLQKTYGDNFAQALQTLIQGKLYLKAVYEERGRNKETTDEDYIVTLIEPELLSYAETLQSNIERDSELLASHKKRLQIVRENQKNSTPKTADIYNIGGEADDTDMISDTSSINSSRYTASSRGTGKTFRSSKNRRKHERKIFSLKPGNPFEDIAIIDMLHGHITKIIGQQQHMHDTCKALMELQHDRQAASIQQHFKRLLENIKDCLPDIWIAEMIVSSEGREQMAMGPGMAFTDFMQLRNEQRYSLLDPSKRFAPPLSFIDWEHEILRGQC